MSATAGAKARCNGQKVHACYGENTDGDGGALLRMCTECCDCWRLAEAFESSDNAGHALQGQDPTFRPLLGAGLQNKRNPLQISVLMTLNSVKAVQPHAHSVSPDPLACPPFFWPQLRALVP